MQVPPDLASRLQHLASSHGSSPEVFLREAISRMIEDVGGAPCPEPNVIVSASSTAALDQTPHLHAVFVPQPLSVSVYE